MRPDSDRQWIEDVIAHRATGAVPYNFMFSPRTQRAAEARYGAPLEDRLAFPIRMGGPTSIKPLYADPALFGNRIRDEFGVTWSTNPIDRGGPVGPVLREPSLAGYRFPSFREEYRFAPIGDWCRANAGHFRVLWIGDLWERATFMRGMEELLLDTALNPSFVDALLRGLADYILGTLEVVSKRYEFEAVALSDDYGTQRSMVISPTSWKRHVKPLLAEIYGAARKRGKRTFHHTCGHVVPIIPDFIELGLDILHPIQPEAMDIFDLKRRFGRDLTFCGGVSTQDLLVHGRPEDIRREVRRLKETMAEGGGYILEPGITLQADVPEANLWALMEEATDMPGATAGLAANTQGPSDSA